MNSSKYTQITLLFLLMTFVLAACSGSTPEASGKKESQYKDITAVELQSMLENKDFILVNVHVPYKGHIAQTDIFIPYDQIDQNLGMLPEDKGAKIVLYCQGGNMSTIAAKTLANLGYTNVYQLIGGFESWREAGLPLETQQP
jgi:rhodanese-related sulfurtransferase